MRELDRAFDTPEAKRRYVRELFATIADRYDLITVVLSYGMDRRWKRRLIDEVPVLGDGTGRWRGERGSVGYDYTYPPPAARQGL